MITYRELGIDPKNPNPDGSDYHLMAVAAEDTVGVPIESPFLPNSNIQFAWDATSLDYLKRCPRLYYYKMIKGYQSAEENVHLRYGSEVHTSFHDYELLRADGIDHDEAVFHTVRELLYRVIDWKSDHKYKNARNAVRMVIGYLDKFKNDPAKTLKLQNGKPAVEVSFRFELDFGPDPVLTGMPDEQLYILCGHLDRVVDFNDEIFIMDRKTTTQTPGSYYWNQFDPNNQMTTYTLAGKIVFQTNIKGVIIDACQILLDNPDRFTRGITYRNQDTLEEWLVDLRHWLDMAVTYAQNDYWPMNDTACDKYGGCQFREICSKSPSVRDKFLKSDFTQEERWNPLKPR